jgi:hypothetical protein
MNAFEQLIEAITFSYEASTWITWLVIIFGGAKTLEAFNKAYKDNANYNEMMMNKDKTGISQFYYGVIISFLCVFVFFLPYLMR